MLPPSSSLQEPLELQVTRRTEHYFRVTKELQAHLKDYLPPNWNIWTRLCLEFCMLTREQLEVYMTRYDPPDSVPAEGLKRLLKAATKFESSATTHFGKDHDTDKDVRSDRLQGLGDNQASTCMRVAGGRRTGVRATDEE